MSGMVAGESVSSPFQWEEDSGDSRASSLLLDTVLQDLSEAASLELTKYTDLEHTFLFE